MSPIEVFCCLLCVTLLLLIIYFLIRVERVLVQGFEGHVENYEHLVQLIRREVTRNEERRRLRRRRSENHIVPPNTNHPIEHNERQDSETELKYFHSGTVILAKIEADGEPVRHYKRKFTYHVMRFHHSL